MVFFASFKGDGVENQSMLLGVVGSFKPMNLLRPFGRVLISFKIVGILMISSKSLQLSSPALDLTQNNCFAVFKGKAFAIFLKEFYATKPMILQTGDEKHIVNKNACT